MKYDGRGSACAFSFQSLFSSDRCQRRIMLIVLAACIALALANCQNTTAQVTWSTEYSVRGLLSLPYGEIYEPFTAYYSTKLGASRIDYYEGTTKTYQLSKDSTYGASYEVVPITTEEVTNQITCFLTSGTESDAVDAQSLLPNMTGFTSSGIDFISGVETQKWVKVVKDGEKVNYYAMWLRWQESTTTEGAVIPIPVKYEMRGYDSLIGSHYDHYYLTYEFFSPEAPSSDVFVIQSKSTCGSLEGSGSMARMNPMKEYIHSYSDHIENDFHSFKKQHGKNYESDVEHSKRYEIFRKNHRYIHSINRANLGYKLAINHLADRTDDELAALRGRKHKEGYNGGQQFPYSETQLRKIELPQNHDWRLYGAVTQVKDQGTCGSCWSFGSAGTVEGAYFLKTGKLVRLSSQALVDCSWGFGNDGCDGGLDYQSYGWMLKHGGIPSEYEYGGYLGQDSYCHISEVEMLAPITGWVNVTTFNEKALKTALFKHGPISVSIDASLKSFSFYSNGVYYDKECKSDSADLDHSVLAVGYGVMHGKKYWLIKNSWSNYWGNDGYVLIAAKNNNCGVMTAPTYVTM